ncbi:small nuclear ribonucleoprotein SmD3b isoform X1 [Vigna angularis]|uniref:small nuclear ribonucleoprotein SmD3b isoform X1 n=1 Tax=Phaseolus angularis TaxID=3914 RepID=UPI000809E99D|nr:small nuclear ribonucleoprotein SmD3b isoform X1 [Vigna angularis]XP_017433340.1 small nuclear ribonucleoprotein SmD3b isoform X1 [Vigna angularis]XP_052733482.1 small nuclear ribonucleoprotein SmD3b isoform X1 [Vigna angularis]
MLSMFKRLDARIKGKGASLGVGRGRAVAMRAKDGKSSQLEHVSIRDSKVRFIVIPDMLKNAPMFKRLDARIKGKGASLGVGRGRAVAIRAKAQAAGRGVAPGRGVPPVRR